MPGRRQRYRPVREAGVRGLFPLAPDISPRGRKNWRVFLCVNGMDSGCLASVKLPSRHCGERGILRQVSVAVIAAVIHYSTCDVSAVRRSPPSLILVIPPKSSAANVMVRESESSICGLGLGSSQTFVGWTKPQLATQQDALLASICILRR
ncbi:hypothetical protein CC78DRAFT_587145 [Lojkania enalia]|uniref:Uncharacterized protein n=1 Tax=Lojkania enalia TaxID=147567 RepID=A0A9P4K2U5_9PLEO|nr:hypothetical protein CC78DRAFT_587145 [Didymosphaeria enalia]